MTLFEALREDHDIQRALVDELVETHGDTNARATLFATLRASLEAHAEAEERHLYRHMMGHDRTMEMARHSVAEHKELDDYIEELEQTDPSSPHWLAVAKKLAHRLKHHLVEEEREVFQQAGHVLEDTQKTQLAHDYRAMMDEALGERAAA